MKSVLVPIANGTEEIEAVTVIDTLRRAEAKVCVASVEQASLIKASRAVAINADITFAELSSQDWDLIVLPGGLPGAEALSLCSPLIELVRHQLQSGKLCAAICAAPAVVLGRNNLIHRYQSTCYPAFQDELHSQCAKVSNARVCMDDNLITSQGPGTALEFSLQLVEILYGLEKRQAVGDAMLYVPAQHK